MSWICIHISPASCQFVALISSYCKNHVEKKLLVFAPIHLNQGWECVCWSRFLVSAQNVQVKKSLWGISGLIVRPYKQSQQLKLIKSTEQWFNSAAAINILYIYYYMTQLLINIYCLYLTKSKIFLFGICKIFNLITYLPYLYSDNSKNYHYTSKSYIYGN